MATLLKSVDRDLGWGKGLALAAGFAGAALALVAAFNIVIDPVGLWRSPHWYGFNAYKPRADRYERVYRAAEIDRLRPRVLLLGDSRARLALSPARYRALTGEAAYNASLGGTHIRELQAVLDHALRVQPGVSRVVLALYRGQFEPWRAKRFATLDFEPGRLRSDVLPARDYVTHTLSLTALDDSWRTLVANRLTPAAEGYGPEGEDRGLAWRKRPEAAGSRSNFAWYLKGTGQMPCGENYDPAEMQSLRTLVRHCDDRQIDLEVCLFPVHAVELENGLKGGRCDAESRFRADLAAITPYWDFAGYNAVTTEPLSDHMANYLDPTHARPPVGDLMLDRLFAPNGGAAPPDFGIRVTEDTAPARWRAVLAARDRWRRGRPEVLGLLQN